MDFFRKKTAKRYLSIVFLTLLGGWTPNVFALNQPPPGASSDVIEKKIRKEAQAQLLSQKPIVPPEIEEEKPPEKKPAAAAAFYVRTIKLKGNEVLKPEEVEPVLKPYEGRKINSGDLADLKKKLEDLFRRHGYLAVAYVPPQDVENGELTVGILTSRMGKLKIEGLHYSSAWKMRSYWKIPEGRILQYQEIQRSLIHMNQNPDRVVKSVLRPGAEAGKTDIYLKAEEHFPVHPGFTWDNQGVKATGKERYGFTLKHTNFLRLDDTFLAGTSFGSAFGALYLSHIIPLTDFGTSFFWGFSYADVSPRKEFKDFHINAISQTYSLGLQQRLAANEHFRMDGRLGFDFKEKTNHQQTVTNIWDRLRVLSLGLDLQSIGKTGTWFLGQDAAVSFSPRGNGNPLNSRGAHESFFKYAFSAKRIQALPFETQGILALSGQLSPYKLPPTEQFFLGGATTVRGYPESDYGADQGLLARAEYNTPFFFAPKSWQLPRAGEPLRKQITLIAFFDYGYGQLRDPSNESNEHRVRVLDGIGGGFSVRFNRYISARFEWAAALRDALTEGGRSQFHFRLTTDI